MCFLIIAGGLLRGVDPELINLSYEAVKTGDLRKLSNWKIQNEGEDESIDNEPAQDDLEFLAEQEEEVREFCAMNNRDNCVNLFGFLISFLFFLDAEFYCRC